MMGVLVTFAQADLQDDQGGDGVIRVQWAYNTADPVAVVLSGADGNGSFCWTFSRDLVVDAVYKGAAAGHGDVGVAVDDGELIVRLSGDGDAMLAMPVAGVQAWLDMTVRAVPLGEEINPAELDAELALFMRPTA